MKCFAALESKAHFEAELKKAKHDAVTTEIEDVKQHPFYYAEDYHQQYLHKNPDGYCGLKGTGVKCTL